MEIEFGSSQPLRFAKMLMYDGDGNVILCKCGKPAGSGVSGTMAYIAWCEDCPPYKDSSVTKMEWMIEEIKEGSVDAMDQH